MNVSTHFTQKKQPVPPAAACAGIYGQPVQPAEPTGRCTIWAGRVVATQKKMAQKPDSMM